MFSNVHKGASIVQILRTNFYLIHVTYCSCDLSKVVFSKSSSFSLCSYTRIYKQRYHHQLKLYVESTIVEKFLDASNATEWVVRSDSHSSPLLKEASMKMYASENNSSVLESEGWSQYKSRKHILSLYGMTQVLCRKIIYSAGQLSNKTKQKQ